MCLNEYRSHYAVASVVKAMEKNGANSGLVRKKSRPRTKPGRNAAINIILLQAMI